MFRLKERDASFLDVFRRFAEDKTERRKLADEDRVMEDITGQPWGIPIVLHLDPKTFERIPAFVLRKSIGQILEDGQKDGWQVVQQHPNTICNMSLEQRYRLQSPIPGFKDYYHLALFVFHSLPEHIRNSDQMHQLRVWEKGMLDDRILFTACCDGDKKERFKRLLGYEDCDTWEEAWALIQQHPRCFRYVGHRLPRPEIDGLCRRLPTAEDIATYLKPPCFGKCRSNCGCRRTLEMKEKGMKELVIYAPGGYSKWVEVKFCRPSGYWVHGYRYDTVEKRREWPFPVIAEVKWLASQPGILDPVSWLDLYPTGEEVFLRPWPGVMPMTRVPTADCCLTGREYAQKRFMYEYRTMAAAASLNEQK